MPTDGASLTSTWPSVAVEIGAKKEPGTLCSGLLVSLWVSGLAGKGAAASAAALNIGVVDGETGAHETVHVVELRAHDIWDAHGVDQHSDALGLEDLVVVGDLVVEVDAVLETGAAPGPDADTQREVFLAFLGHEGLDLLGGIVGDVYDGRFLLFHQHLPCCSLLSSTEIITPPAVYFNAAFVRSSEAFPAASYQAVHSWPTGTSSTWRAARMGSRPRAPSSSAVGARRLVMRPCKRRPRGPLHRSRSRGGPSRPGRTGASGPLLRRRPRRGAAFARWGSVRASRPQGSCSAVARREACLSGPCRGPRACRGRGAPSWRLARPPRSERARARTEAKQEYCSPWSGPWLDPDWQGSGSALWTAAAPCFARAGSCPGCSRRPGPRWPAGAQASWRWPPLRRAWRSQVSG